jgi:hypothetical protein
MKIKRFPQIGRQTLVCRKLALIAVILCQLFGIVQAFQSEICRMRSNEQTIT